MRPFRSRYNAASFTTIVDVVPHRRQRGEMAIAADPEGNEVAALDPVRSFGLRRVLEIGCGDGRLTRQYVSYASSVTAIDPNAGAVDRLAREFPAVDARAIEIDELLLPPESFDVVLLAWSL
jgi:2-polyprenyl-3-methyl-5-hydroxy-6-metoxy-1,4-benzoquinol methylase